VPEVLLDGLPEYKGLGIGLYFKTKSHDYFLKPENPLAIIERAQPALSSCRFLIAIRFELF
jgi:hypothetical protein